MIENLIKKLSDAEVQQCVDLFYPLLEFFLRLVTSHCQFRLVADFDMTIQRFIFVILDYDLKLIGIGARNCSNI